MPAMTKYVKVVTRVAVRTVNPPICGTYEGIMTTSDILKCLCRRAQVDEILANGATVRLNMSNYYRDNGAGLDASDHRVKPVVENVERFKVPVAPMKAQVVETKTEEPIQEAKDDECVTVDEVPVELPTADYGQMSIVGEEETVTEAILEVAEDVVDAEPEATAEEDEDSEDEMEETSEVEAATTNTQNTNRSGKKKKGKKH